MESKMIRPEDIERMIGKIPNWIELNPVEKKTEPQKSEIRKDELILVTGVSGFLDSKRAFAFYRNAVGGGTVIPDDPDDSDNYASRLSAKQDNEMIPLGKYPGMRSQNRARQLWGLEGNLLHETIVKVFVGWRDKADYGMMYFIADKDTPQICAFHPDEPTLHFRGGFRRPTGEEVEQFNLNIPKSRNFTMEVAYQNIG